MGGEVYRGKNAWGEDQSIYFGDGWNLTDQPGFEELSEETKAKIRKFDHRGTARGYDVDPTGNGGKTNAPRAEVQPDRIIFSYKRGPEALELMIGDMSKRSLPFSIFRDGDIRPVLERDLPEQYRRGYVPPQDQEVE